MENVKHFKPCDFVIFGVLGDLAGRKLIPSLYQLEKAGLLEPSTWIVGVARHELIIRLQPKEGVEIEILNKVPGIDIGVRLQSTLLDLSFFSAFKNERIADAYERLLLETMRGTQALFIHRDEIE